VHQANNSLLLHGRFSLEIGVFDNPEGGTRRYLACRSGTHVHDALMGACFSYVHTMSLVLDREALKGLERVWGEHAPRFITLKPVR
jgi:hypothetical protein